MNAQPCAKRRKVGQAPSGVPPAIAERSSPVGVHAGHTAPGAGEHPEEERGEEGESRERGKKGGGARAVRSAKRTREYTTAYSSGGKPPKPRGREKAGDAREHKKKTSRHSTCEPKRGGRRQTPYNEQEDRPPLKLKA